MITNEGPQTSLADIWENEGVVNRYHFVNTQLLIEFASSIIFDTFYCRSYQINQENWKTIPP